MANESEISCSEPPVAAAAAAVVAAAAAGGPPRRSCRARRLNSRFVNDEVDEGYRQLVARISAPDSHSILQSPQLAFHHISPAPPPQPTTSLPTPTPSKTSVIAVTTSSGNAASVTHAKKAVVSTLTNVKKPVVKKVRRHSQDSSSGDKDNLTSKKVHRGSVDSEGSDKSVTIKKTAKLIGNSIKKIKGSVSSLKSQKNRKDQPATSDSEDDIPLANLVSKGSCAASECSSDDGLPLTELAARNKQPNSESYNCDLPSNYCIKTIHNPDLSSTPISIVCIEDPDEEEQLETPKVKKVKRKTFSKMFNTPKKTKLDLASAISNKKESKESLNSGHFLEQNKHEVKNKNLATSKQSGSKKDAKEGKYNTKLKVKLPIKPSQGKLLKILNLKVVPTTLPELPNDNPLAKLIVNKNLDAPSSETKQERTTIKCAVFPPNISSTSSESDKEVSHQDGAKGTAVNSLHCTSSSSFKSPSKELSKSSEKTESKEALESSNKHEFRVVIPKQEANNSSVSGQSNAGNFDYNALSSILKSESPPCLDGLIQAEMTLGKSKHKNETTNLSFSPKIGNFQSLASKIVKGSENSKSILSVQSSPSLGTTTSSETNTNRVQLEQNPVLLSVAKTEADSEQFQTSQVSSLLLAQPKCDALLSPVTVLPPRKDECMALHGEGNLLGLPSKLNSLSMSNLNSFGDETSPNKIQKKISQDDAKIKCKRRSDTSPSGGSSCKKLKQETSDEIPKVNKSYFHNSSSSALHQGLFTDRSPLKSENVVVNDSHWDKEQSVHTPVEVEQSCENVLLNAPKPLKIDPYEQKPDLAVIRDTREQWETDDKGKAFLSPSISNENKEKPSVAKKEKTPKQKVVKKVSLNSNNGISPNTDSNLLVNNHTIEQKGVSPALDSVDSKADIKPALLITKIIDGVETEVKPIVKRRESPSSAKARDTANSSEVKPTSVSNKTCEPSTKHKKEDHSIKSISTNPIVKSEPLDISSVTVSPSSSKKSDPNSVQTSEVAGSMKGKEKSREKKVKESKLKCNLENEKKKTTKSKMEKEKSERECKARGTSGKVVTKGEKTVDPQVSSEQDPRIDGKSKVISKDSIITCSGESGKIGAGKNGPTLGLSEKGDRTKKTTEKDDKTKVIIEKELKIKSNMEKDKRKDSKEKEEKAKRSLECLSRDKEKSKGFFENEIKGKEKSKSNFEKEVKASKSIRGSIEGEDKTKGRGERENTGKDDKLREEKSRSGVKGENKELTGEASRKDSRGKSPGSHKSLGFSKEGVQKDDTGTKTSRSKSSHHRRSSSSDHKIKEDRNSDKRRDSSSSSSSKSSRRESDKGDTKKIKKVELTSPSPIVDTKDANVMSANTSDSPMDMDIKTTASVNNLDDHVELHKDCREQKPALFALPNMTNKVPGNINPPSLQELGTETTNVGNTTAGNIIPVAKKEVSDAAVEKPVSRVTELLNMCRANIPSESCLEQASPVQQSALLVCNSPTDSKSQSVNNFESFVPSLEIFEKASCDIPSLTLKGELVSHISKRSRKPDSDSDASMTDEETMTPPPKKKSTDSCAVLLDRVKELGYEKSSDKEEAVDIKSERPGFITEPDGLGCSVVMKKYFPSNSKSDHVLTDNSSVDGSVSPSSNTSCLSPSPTKREPSPVPPETAEERERREALEAEREHHNEAIVEERMKSFEHLSENLYLTDRKKSKQSKEVRRMVCDCILTKEELSRGEKGCGDDCLNRLLMIECGWRCPLGDACLNRSFQRCEYGPVQVFNAEEKGCGVKAIKEIPLGTFILEYVGEVFDQREFRRRRKEYGKDGTAHFYFMALKADQFIDATKKGNISRFVNHSCDPNAETQKWTVNGELRIGFFSTKTISAGEEINFDYRMERYGREPQKCYCGTEVCRGWLGEPPDELTKEEKEEERKRNALTAVSDKPADKRKKEGKKQQFDDELQDDLSELRRVGLRNRQYTLMLSRVMVRAESEHTRSQLLLLLCAAFANTPCLRLFMDYHGLSLLWSWMADLSVDLEHAPLKLQILKTLDILPITNRTQVADSRVLEVVEKWSKQTPPPPSASSPVTTNSSAASSPSTITDPNKKSSDGSEDSDDVTVDESSQDSVDAPTSGAKPPSSDDSSSDSNSSKSRSILPQKDLVDGETLSQQPQQDTQKEDLLRKTQTEMVELALKLVSRWQVLKEEFRIPRKQRVQLMKEHEREVEAGYKRYLDTERGRREMMESRYNSRRDSYYDRWRNKIAPVDHDKDARRWQPNNDAAISINDAEFAGLSKEERREKFAQKVAIEDEQRRVQEGMWTVHVERCARSGLDPYQTPIIDPSGQYYWDASNSNWVPLTPQTAYAAGVLDPATAEQHAAAMAAMAGGDPGLCYSSAMEPETAVNPHYIPTANGEVLQPVVVTINLPLHWHIARDQHNRVYFYHSRSRQTQWEIPTPETKTTVQYETDSESDSESSSSSDSEEEFSSDDGDANDDEVAKASAAGEAGIDEPETVEGKIIRRQRGKKRHSEALVQQRVISPIRELDREQARKERREAKERARHEARRERLHYQEQLLSKELGVAAEDGSDDEPDAVIEEPKMLYPPRDKFKVKSKERAATAIADTSDKARKIKDLFRSRMATFIVSVLNPYRRVDCKQGRINTTEDFKYLARKLTHFVMVKELKQLPSIEGLDCSDSVKHKTKDFVRKYMAKYGSSFKRDPNDTKEY